MFEMWDHLVYGLQAFLANPANVSLSILTLILALLILIKLRDSALPIRRRLALIYAHLALISFPPVLLASTLGCASIGLECPVTIARIGLYLIPISIIVSMLVGTLLLPRFYMIGASRTGEFGEFLRREAARLGIRIPSVYIYDSPKPQAYSINLGNAIFISLGMKELFSGKEIEAVLLHELNHLQRNAPTLKVTTAIMNIFSPFAKAVPIAFTKDEELRADQFAAERQRTRRHLESAKNKSGKFD